MKPTISSDVHYVLSDGSHRPAKVWNVHTFTVQPAQQTACALDLEVFGPPNASYMTARSDMRFPGSVVQDEATKAVGTWHWPEREE